MPVMMPGAAVLVIVPDGKPHSTVLCELECPLFNSPRNIIINEWSLFLNTGVNVSVCVVLTLKFFDELAVVRLLCWFSVSFQPVVFSDNGMNVSSNLLKTLNTTFPSYTNRVWCSASPNRL